MMCPPHAAEQPKAKAVLARERLVAVSLFASSVSHAMNNALFGVGGNLEFLLSGGTLDAGTEEVVAESLASLAAGDALAGELASVGRREPYRPSVVDVREAIRDWSRGAASRCCPDIVVDLLLPQEPAPVFVDPGYLQCALNTLLRNAVDPLGGASRALVACDLCAGDEIPAAGRSGRFVRISIADPGSGMRPEAASHASGRGGVGEGGRSSGIGLWLVREFARACAGEVCVGGGGSDDAARVSLFLPSLEAQGQEGVAA